MAIDMGPGCCGRYPSIDECMIQLERAGIQGSISRDTETGYNYETLQNK